MDELVVVPIPVEPDVASKLPHRSAGSTRTLAAATILRTALAAAAGGAHVIVSGDARHLLSMHPWRGIPIIFPVGYLALP